jgi:hypothetical protein
MANHCDTGGATADQRKDTAALMIANVFRGDADNRLAGDGDGPAAEVLRVGGGTGGPVRCSVHSLPSQYRCPGTPLGSGCQPGGGNGAVTVSPS